MSYMKPRRSPEREQLHLFVNDVKREIDTFWSNILEEFNTFSNDITTQLNKIDQEYTEYRRKYDISGDDRIASIIANKIHHDQFDNHDGHRSSLEVKQKHSSSHHSHDDDHKHNTDAEMFTEQKQQYKKFARSGNNISHGRTLSTMEIPSSFRLDPIEESILIIKPRAATTHCKDIYTTLLDENFYVTDFEEGRATAQYFEELWTKKYGYVSYFKELCAEMAIETFLVLKVFRVNAINELIDLCGHEDPQKADNDNPNTLRAMFGVNAVQNAVYPAKNQAEVEQFKRDFFTNTKQNTPNNHMPQQQSLLVIKPNAAKQFGDIIRATLVGQNFEIIQQKVFNLNSFVYSNMTYDAPPQYTQDIIDYMASGAVIALIVQKTNVYKELERAVGDRDPEVAVQLQPESIRAHYGESIVKNAIEYAQTYEIYKANIPTFFFDAQIMNQAIDMSAIEQLKNDAIFQQSPESGASQEETHSINLEQLEDATRYAICVIKPHVSSYQIEAIQDTFADHDIAVNKQKSMNMPYESIKEMLRIEYRNNEVIQLMANHLASNEVLVWLVSSKTNKNIFRILSEIVPAIREQYGIDEIRDVMHFSTSTHNFKTIAHEFFFEFGGPTPPKTPNMNLKLKSLDEINKPSDNGQGEDLKHQRRDTEVKPFISQFAKEQRSIIVIKRHITKNQLFQIRKMLHDASIEVIQEKQMNLPIDILYNAFEMDGYEEDEYHSMCQYIASDEFIVWMVQRENVYEQLRYVVGPEHPIDAKSKYPQSIRAYYGLDKIRNAVYFAPNEHIYNHQVGIFFFHDGEANDPTEIPNVPSVLNDTANKFNYINDALLQIKKKQSIVNVNDTPHGDDEYALVLLSSSVSSSPQILDQIKSRISVHKFVIVDQLSSFFPPNVVSEMFDDGHSSFSADGPPIPSEQFNALLNAFSNGEIMALHVCRQNAYLLLDQLRKELEQHNLITSIYITLSASDYNSKCAHFFNSGHSDHDRDHETLQTPNKSVHAQSVHSQRTRKTVESVDNNERAIIIFKPHTTDKQKSDIRSMLLDEMLHVFDETSTYIPRKTLRDLLSNEGYDEYYMDLICEHMAGNALEAWLVKGENVYKDLMLIVGPEDSDVARIQAPNSIRAKYGIDRIQNVLYFTKSKQVFEETHRYFFFDEPASQKSPNVNENGSTGSRQNKPLHQQMEEFERKSALSSHAAPPLRESDEEQRAVLILQHYLKASQINTIRNILERQHIDIVQEKEAYLPIDTYRHIFELSQPNWTQAEIEKACQFYNQGQCIAFLVGKPNIYRLLNDLVGNENPLLAEHGTIRQLFGIDELQNACFFTRNERSYQAIVDDLFFDPQAKTAKSQISELESSHHHPPTASSAHPSRMKPIKSVGSALSSQRSFRTNEQEKSILVFKPHMKEDAINTVDSMLHAAGLSIINQKTSYLPSDVWRFCMKEEVVDDVHLDEEARHLSSGSITAYLVVGDDAFDTLADLAGAPEPKVAKLHHPQSIRALFGIDEVRNCVWWSKNRRTYKRIFNKFFFSEYKGNTPSQTAANTVRGDEQSTVRSSVNKYPTSQYKPGHTDTASASSSMRSHAKTLIIIKPHVAESVREDIKQMLTDRGISIIQEKATHLAKESCRYLMKAEGFDENYSNILVDEMNKGELCALLVSKEGIFQELNAIVGPSDPALARKTAPHSIRAKYGKDVVRNAIYYTKSKRHYKKVFSFFFFEDVSEKKLDQVTEADNSNSALLTMNGDDAYNVSMKGSDYMDTAENETMSRTSYGYQDSHRMYGQTAPCAVLIIKPHAMEHQKSIETVLESHDIMILSKRNAAIHAEAIYGFLKDNQAFQSLNEQIMNLIVQDMCNGNVCVYCLGDRNNQSFNKIEVGLHRVTEISKIISSKFGLDQIRNAVYVSRNIEEMRKQRKFFFLDSVFFKHETIDDSYQYSMMIVKPNAFQYREKIIQLLKSKEFNVVVNKRMKLGMELSIAQQFFHPYYGTVEEFDEYCESMSTGPLAVLVVSRVGNCISALRQFTEQIQTMYQVDDRSIASHAVYTCECESDFWRDRAFFFFSNSAVQFMDEGSVRSFRKGRSRKGLSAPPSQHDQQSVQSAETSFTNLSEQMSVSFALMAVEESVLLIKPHAAKYKRDIERILLDKGFYIAKQRSMNIPQMVWADFYAVDENKPWFDDLCSAMAEDQCISYRLYRVQAIKLLRKLVGHTDPNIARQRSPKCLRAMYGESIIRNGFHCSHDKEAVIKEKAELFFEDSDAIWGNSTTTTKHRNTDRVFVIIKPNSAKLYGDNIRTHLVANGFMVVKQKVFHLSESIYMNLSLDVSAQYFEQSIQYLASDQIIVMIVEKQNGYEDIVEVIGHRNPSTASRQQPDSIRAIYGKNVIQNAIEASFNEEMYRSNYDIFFEDESDNLSETKSYKRAQEQRRHEQYKLKQVKQRNQKDQCLLIIKPHVDQQHIEYIKQMLIRSEFEIMSERHTNMPYHAFTDAFNHDEDANSLDAVCRQWCSGEITVFVLSKLNAFSTIRTLVGPDDPEIARSEAPQSIRAMFGQDRIRNVCWFSRDEAQYKLKLQHFDY